MPEESGPGEPRRIARWLERRFGGVYDWLAAFAAMSVLVLIVSDVAMWFVLPDYNPFGQTISDAAAGPNSWLADAAIITFALGILALAVGLALIDDADHRSWIVRVSLVLLSVDLMVLALRNEYGDADPGGIVVHDYAVVVMGVLVAIVLWFAPPPDDRRLTRQTRALAIIWILGAGTLDFVPDAWEGLHERVLMVIMGAAVLAAAWRLHAKARAA